MALQYKILNKGNAGSATQVASNDWDLVIKAFQGQTSGIPKWEMRSLNGVLYADDVLLLETPSGSNEIHVRTSNQSVDANLKVPSLVAGDNVLVIDSIENDFLARNIFHKEVSFSQTATPTAPPAGEIVVWMDNDTQLKMMDSDGNIFIFGSASVGEPNTTSSVGTGEGTITKPKVVFDLPFKSIKAGTNITITNNTDDITIAAAALVPGLHSAQHAVGGGDPFVKGNDLAVASRYLEDIADPASDAQRIWMVDAGNQIKYWSDEGSPVKHTLAALGIANVFTEAQKINFSTGSALLTLYRPTNTAGNGSRLDFSLNDSGGAEQQYAQIRGEIGSPTAGAETGEIVFSVAIAGSLDSVARINDEGVFEMGGPNHRVEISESGQTSGHRFTFPNADSLLFGSGADNNLGDHYLDIGDIVVPANPAAGIRRIFLDSATGKLSVRTSAGTTLSLEEQPGAAGAHKANHVVGGSDPFAKNDNLAAACRYLEDIADPTSDSQRIWLVDGSDIIKYWSDEVTPVKHTLAALGIANSFTVDQTFINIFQTGYQDFTEIAAPANPAANHGRVYFDSADEVLKIKKSSGTVVNLESGGGGGGDSISVNGTAATDADFDDATPAAPAGGVNVKWSKDSGTPNNISAHLNADDVSNTVLANMAANTIKGNNTASSTDPTDIAMATNTILARQGSNIVALAVGTNSVVGRVAGDIVVAQLATGQVADAAITLAKMANIATNSLIGRDTAASGVPENILLNATLEMDGSLNLQRAALTGDVTAPAGSNTTAIAAGVIVDADINASGITTRSKLPSALAYEDEGNTFTIEQKISKNIETLLTIHRDANTNANRTSFDLAADSSTGVERVYAQVQALINDNTNTTEDGALVLKVRQNGAMDEIAWMDGTGIYFGNLGDLNIKLIEDNLTAEREFQFPDANSVLFGTGVDNVVGTHFLEFEQIVDPTAPAANKVRLYLDNSDTHLKVIKNGGTIVDLESGGGGGSENTSASNVGTGEGVFKTEVGDDLQFKSLIGGTNIDITNNTNDLTFDVPDASTTVKGAVELATSGENAANVAVQGNDSRLSDARTPTAHKASHVSGGSDTFAKGDNLVAAAQYLEDIADPASDAQRIWLVDGSNLIKYWSDEGSPVKHTVAVLDLAQTFTDEITLGASSGVTRLDRNTSTIGNGVEIRYNLRDNGALVETYSKTRSEIKDNVNGSEDAVFQIHNKQAGTLIKVLEVDENGLLTIGANQRLLQSESGLTAARTFTYPDANSKLLGDGIDNNLGDHYLDIGDITAPSNPAAGVRRLFVDSGTGKLSVRTSGGTTVSLEEVGGGSGDNITINGVAATDADFDDATPAAPSNAVNVKWQKDSGTPNNVSAYLDVDTVSNFILANMAGFTIKAKPSTGSGDPSDLSVAADRLVGRDGSGDIDDIQVKTAHVADAQITLAKLANIGTDRLIGRDTAASGVPEEVSLSTGLEFSGSTSIRVSSIVLRNDLDNALGAHFLEFDEIADPTAPAANKGRLFFDNTDEHLKIIKNGGTVVDLEATGSGGAHKDNHVVGGSDPFVKGDNLAAAAQYLEDVADPSSDAQRIWMVDASNLIKYWSDETTPVKYTLPALEIQNIFTAIQTSKLDNSQPIRIRRDNNVVGTGVELPLGLEASDGTDSDYARIRAEIVVNTAGAETGELKLQQRIAGSMITCLRFIDSGVAQFEKGLALGDVISPSQLTANTNDWNPTDLQSSAIIRVNTDANMRQLTGITAPVPESNRYLTLRNISANTLLLRSESSASSAANRFDFNGYDLPLFPDDEIVLKYDTSNNRWICENYMSYVIPSARLGYYYRHDMFGTVADPTLSSQVSGTGAANSVSAVTSEAGHPGVVQAQTGTTTTGMASMLTTNLANILLGQNWYWRFEAMIRIPTLSVAASQLFNVEIGFLDATGAITDGLIAFYVDNINSGKWVLRAVNNTTNTDANDTGTAVAANTWYRLVITCFGSEAHLYVNGTEIAASISSGLPTGAGRGTGFGAMITKGGVGSTSRTMDIDYIEVIGYKPTES